jgi:DNA-binding FrmR family transcriptional regulator
MSHTIREKRALLARVRKMGGQIRALERSLDEERACGEILHLLAAVRGATNGLMGVVLEEHVRAQVPAVDGDPAVDELVGVMRSYLK